MRKLIFLLPLLLALGCQQSANDAGAAAEAAPAESEASGSHESKFDDAAEPGDDTQIAVFAGTVDYIPFVMYLEMPHAAATGHYFYTKQGKRINLSGSYDAGAGKYELDESVGGKTTGHFSVMLSEEAISGTWYAKPGATPLNVEGRRLDVPYEPNGSIGKRISGRYTYAHTTQDMSTEDSPEEDVTDMMALRYIGGGYFSFYLSVIGANYHTGEVAGLAKMTDDNHAKTEIDDCALTFEFKPGMVNVDEEDCGYYHGARASFDVELTRE
jgi:hypothetical protein